LGRGGSKILGGEENPAFPGKLALGKRPCIIGARLEHMSLDNISEKKIVSQ
jgi:hypothetical protein